MIYKVSEMLAVDPLIKLMHKKKDVFKISDEKAEQYLLGSIVDKNSALFIDEKDSEVRGFLYASIETLDGEEITFIHACVSDESNPNTVFELIAHINKWSIEKGMKKMCFLTGRSPKAFARKYRFEVDRVLLTRPITTAKDKKR